MIRSVDLVVAVQAGLAQQVDRRRVSWQAAFILRQARVTGLRMAALAKRRRTHAQHARVIRAMWIVAVTTVLDGRCMLPKVGSAILCVAFVTGTVLGLVRDRRAAEVAVCAVAIAAGHLSLAYGMGKRFHGLRPLLLVTVKADLGLR